jgi:uncharacterized protein YukE
MDLSGMDVQEVTALVGALEMQASVVSAVIGTVDGIVAALVDVWEGHDLEAFATSWQQIHRTNASATANELAASVRNLRQQIAEQEHASGGPLAIGALDAAIALEASGARRPGGLAGLERALQAGGLGLLAGSLGGLFSSPLVKSLYDDVNTITGGLDTEATIIENGLPISDLEKLPGFATGSIAGLEKLETSGAYEKLGTGMATIGAVVSIAQTWGDLKGEGTAERVSTTVETGGADFAINRDPVTAGANFLSLGALQQDANVGIRMANGFVAGLQHDGISGGFHAANMQLNQWADGLAGSSGPLGMLARGENDVINKAYGPASEAIGSAASSASHAVSAAEHLASKVVSFL